MASPRVIWVRYSGLKIVRGLFAMSARKSSGQSGSTGLPTKDELIGCCMVLATIAGIVLAWIVFIAVMAS